MVAHDFNAPRCPGDTLRSVSEILEMGGNGFFNNSLFIHEKTLPVSIVNTMFYEIKLEKNSCK
jgi:uncharacterized protein YcbK (DUF882 family)